MDMVSRKYRIGLRYNAMCEYDVSVDTDELTEDEIEKTARLKAVEWLIHHSPCHKDIVNFEIIRCAKLPQRKKKDDGNGNKNGKTRAGKMQNQKRS